jgi:hypothetical protein
LRVSKQHDENPNFISDGIKVQEVLPETNFSKRRKDNDLRDILVLLEAELYDRPTLRKEVVRGLNILTGSEPGSDREVKK